MFFYAATSKRDFAGLQLVGAVRGVAGGAADSQAVHLRPGPRAEGGGRGAGEGAAPGLLLTQGEGPAETEEVCLVCPVCFQSN